MAKIYGFKSSDGEPKGVAVNDDGELIVNLATVKADIALMKADLAAILAILES